MRHGTDDELIQAGFGDLCAQCAANARHNLAGGYKTLAAQQVRYCTSNHDPRSIESARRSAARALADYFRQLGRIGRWGTCGACPIAGDGSVYPEFCAHTHRPDHLLTPQALAERFDVECREAFNRSFIPGD